MLFVVIMSSCGTKTFKEDPELKESERIAVLEKAKTDSLTVIVKMDDSYYTVRNNQIVSKARVASDDLGAGIFAGIVIALILTAAIGIIVNS